MTWLSITRASALRRRLVHPRPSGSTPLAFAKNPVPSAGNNYTQSFGNVPRNSLRGPAYEDTDISLFKDILGEHRIHGQFQAEAFNAWNHTNFANPASAVSSGTFGHHHRNQQQHGHREYTFAGGHAACVAVCRQDYLLNASAPEPPAASPGTDCDLRARSQSVGSLPGSGNIFVD